MFREIRTKERMTEQDQKKAENYRRIRPEKELTIEECNLLISEVFANLIKK